MRINTVRSSREGEGAGRAVVTAQKCLLEKSEVLSGNGLYASAVCTVVSGQKRASPVTGRGELARES